MQNESWANVLMNALQKLIDEVPLKHEQAALLYNTLKRHEQQFDNKELERWGRVERDYFVVKV